MAQECAALGRVHPQIHCFTLSSSLSLSLTHTHAGVRSPGGGSLGKDGEEEPETYLSLFVEATKAEAGPSLPNAEGLHPKPHTLNPTP